MSNHSKQNYGLGNTSYSDSRASGLESQLKSNDVSAGSSDSDNEKSDNSISDDGKEYEVDPENTENLIRGSSCVRSCSASSAKRFIIYKRDWCGLICQIVIPLILVLFGLWLTSGPSKL